MVMREGGEENDRQQVSVSMCVESTGKCRSPVVRFFSRVFGCLGFGF
jgi:hypothetical protein